MKSGYQSYLRSHIHPDIKSGFSSAPRGDRQQQTTYLCLSPTERREQEEIIISGANLERLDFGFLGGQDESLT